VRKLALTAFILFTFALLRANGEPVLSAKGKLPAEIVAAGPKTAPLSKLSTFEAVVLGIVEGITEYLPISSTGHLIITTDFLNLNTTQPLFDKEGAPLWYRKPSGTDPGELLTVNLATQAYIVVIQFGAIAAIIPICWSQFVAMFWGVLGRNRRGLRLLTNLIIAFLPAAIFGFLLHDWIDRNLYSIGAVISALIFGSLLMFYADRWPSWRDPRRLRHDISELSPAAAAGIGFLECFAMWPGMSRPMMTILGGYLAGLTPGPAAGFSFLLGFVTLSAATVFQSYKSGPLILSVFGWQNVLLGTVIAAVTAALSVKFFVKLLLRSGLTPFAWYRLALAALLFLRGS
jgi:undecaprenyl-diphosphatase